MTAPAVLLERATVTRDGRVIWSGVDLRVAAGELVAVVGPNGAGKSTLLSVLLGLTPLSHGRAEVLGRPAGRSGADIGYLPQRRAFDASVRLRGTDVVRLGVDGDRWGISLPGRRSRAARDRVGAVVAAVGATAYADRPIGALSGGEQQRLLIAQALARHPRLLLLDEPLDSLDPQTQDALGDVLTRVCRSEGVAVLMVTHDVRPLEGRLDGVLDLAAA